MTALINWAIALANTAISLAWQAISDAANAFNDAIEWAGNQIGTAYFNLFVTIGVIAGAVRAFAADLFEQAKSKAIDLYHDALTALVVASLVIYGFIADKVSWVIFLIDAAKIYVILLIYMVQGFLENLINTLIAPFMPLIVWLAGLLALINSYLDFVKAFLTIDNINRILNAINNVVPYFNNVMNDPIGWIASFVQAFLWPMFQYIVAYQFGTIKYDLPIMPKWSDMIGITGDNEIVIIPAQNGALNRPLVALRVSGSHFSSDHRGTDYGLTTGQPVYACHDGHLTIGNCGSPLYGNCVTIDGGEWFTLYAHLQTFVAPNGAWVKKGQKIALGNSTGNSTGPHLHIEIRQNGTYINPESVL